MYPHGPHRPPWRNAAPPMVLYQPPPPPPMLLYPPHPYGPAVGPNPARPQLPYAAAPYSPYFGHYPVPAAAVDPVLQPVTAANFATELDLIGSLLPRYPYVVVDTEYPGTVHHAPAGRSDRQLSPDERYALVKANVDELPIVQLGITLCDAHGNVPFVPDHGYGYGYGYSYFHGGGGGGRERAWEVGFSDFDVRRDRHAAQSVAFLRSQGVDFDAARARGVSSAAFGAKLAEILSAPRGNVELTWVAFGGAYDLAYLVKMLDGGQPLPETRQGFMARVRDLLGGRVFDAKYMAEHCGRADLCDVGLRSVAANLGVPSPAGDVPWLAGTKSLTAYRIHKILKLHVLSHDVAAGFEGIIDGLQCI